MLELVRSVHDQKVGCLFVRVFFLYILLLRLIPEASIDVAPLVIPLLLLFLWWSLPEHLVGINVRGNKEHLDEMEACRRHGL